MSYDQKAIFERQTPLDDFAESGGEWEELFREFVRLLPLTGRELTDAAQVTAENTHRVRLHWVDGLRAQDRFKIALQEPVFPNDPTSDQNFRVFHIESVINVGERNREFELLVKERR